TTYHFRAKADAGVHGTANGTDMTFTTLTPPTVSTGNVTNVTANSATISGNLTSLGSASAVNVFFEYGTTTSYGSKTIAESMTATGTFSANLIGLSPGTTYHFRAQADGVMHGMASGTDTTFTTLTPPTVITSVATNITTNSANVSGNLTSLGTATTANVSFEYGTSTSYGSNTTAQAMTGTGVFSASLTGLSSNTTYHFRAKADGGAHGVANGTDMTFSTLTPPTVITDNATSITANSATVSGNLTSLGTAPTANVSFEYGTTTGYGSSTTAQPMTVTGIFSATLTGLSSNTTYHFRAKADAGGYGIANGTDMTFTTAGAPPPPAPAPGGGGGVGGVGGVEVKEPGVTSVTTAVTSTGEFSSAVTAKSEDAKVKLTIAQGIIGKTSSGSPLSRISIVPMVKPPAPPADSRIVGSTYDLGPDGATFNPPVTLTLSYDPAEFPEGVNQQNLVIAMWLESTGQWVRVAGGTVDPLTRTITAPVSHFTAFAVIVGTRPATFITSGLTISPPEVDSGGNVTISTLVTNVGDLTGSYGVILKIDNLTVATKYVTLAGNTSQTVTFTATKSVAGNYAVSVDGQSGRFMVKALPALPSPPAPAAFAISSLSISPAEVTTGKTVTISVLVTNTGDLTGTYQAILKIGGTVTGTKEITLAGGASQTITFTASKDVAGSFAVNIDGQSGRLTVKTPIVPARPTNWWLIAAIVVAGIALALVGYVLAWRKRRPIVLFDKIYAKFSDKRIVHIYRVRPLGSGKYALLIEFGVRRGMTEGLHIGVNVNAELTNFKTWLDKSETPTITVTGMSVFKKFSRGYQPPMYDQKLKSLNLTPSTSYYWYFETEEPPKVRQLLFMDYYDRKP
ncbi:MAG: hypothetical protein HY663_02005, partial [Chloroflexi bacterium]|nr:hypothetical protein [Chloroflexota bacterium]